MTRFREASNGFVSPHAERLSISGIFSHFLTVAVLCWQRTDKEGGVKTPPQREALPHCALSTGH